MLERKADLATLGNLPIVFATLNQVPLSIVATIANASRGAGIVARRDRDIARAADLKGKTIGVTLGTDGHFVLGVLLAEQGIEMGKVRAQNVPPEEIVARSQTGRSMRLQPGSRC